MATGYKLSYEASEIDEKLGKVDELSADINFYKNYVTPQMFGAIGDGETDDTIAVQAALDTGGIIYFPAGRYKVTSQLTATKSCAIRMFKPYPTTSGGEDYRLYMRGRNNSILSGAEQKRWVFTGNDI